MAVIQAIFVAPVLLFRRGIIGEINKSIGWSL
jgi:hypothetical protein